MDYLIDNVLYIIVFLIISGLVFLFLKTQVEKTKVSDVQSDLIDSPDSLSIKLRAYERLILFLDRIEPVGMINRLNLQNQSAETLKNILIKNIIIEYEYNVSQQIYVSDELWNRIELIKNQTINIISTIIDNLTQEAITADFVSTFLVNSKPYIQVLTQTKKKLKKEVRRLS